MRVVLSEPWQHSRMHLAVEVVHQERAKDRDFLLPSQLVELVFEAHAGGHIALFPEHIYHLTPPANLRETISPARLCNGLSGKTHEQWRIRHGTSHKLGQKLIRINDC